MKYLEKQQLIANKDFFLKYQNSVLFDYKYTLYILHKQHSVLIIIIPNYHPSVKLNPLLAEIMLNYIILPTLLVLIASIITYIYI